MAARPCNECGAGFDRPQTTRCLACARNRRKIAEGRSRPAGAVVGEEAREAQRVAHSAVAAAIRAGELARPSSFACRDCDKPATQYDHRDYTQPLKVEPVCRSCNVMRGPADVWVPAALQQAA